MTPHFTTLDTVILLAYLVGIALFGILRGGRQSTAQDYFLGKGEIPWWVVCFSIVAAETSALTFISIPGLAYLTNVTFLQVTFGYLLGRVLVSVLLLPSYFSGELSTAYAFLERRFGGKTRGFASLVFLFTRVAADGVRLFATAIPLKFVLDVEYPVAILILAVVALAYTYLGGVRGVIWVDAAQMFVYIGGAVAAVIAIAATADGGLAGALSRGAAAGKLEMLFTGFGEGFWQQPYTLVAGLVGGALLSMASHGTDQLIVQRVLTTHSLQAARKALIGSGILVIVQFALFLGVGVLLFDHYSGASPAALGLSRADEIFPRFIVEGLPPGVSGFIVAGLLAAALSTLAGSISSMSSSTVLDLFALRGESKESHRRTLRFSRGVTVIWSGLLVGSAVLFMRSSQAVVELALSIASFTYGGLLGTFLLGVLFRRVTQRAALFAFAAGILVMILVISLRLVAWTWFTPVGVVVTLLVGASSTLFGRRTVVHGQQPR